MMDVDLFRTIVYTALPPAAAIVAILALAYYWITGKRHWLGLALYMACEVGIYTIVAISNGIAPVYDFSDLLPYLLYLRVLSWICLLYLIGGLWRLLHRDREGLHDGI